MAEDEDQGARALSPSGEVVAGKTAVQAGAGRAYRTVDTGQSFSALEERILGWWKERSIFEKSLELRAGRPEWVFSEGPPTANGKPGIHHVLARVFKDIYPRFRTMRGYHVDSKGGWDCHGLPVELEIEKRLGFNHKEQIEQYGVAEFNQLCKESVTAYVDDWNRMTERIGMWLDLDDAYMTMTDDYIESVWWILSRVLQKRPAVRGAQSSSLLPALRHGPLLARGGLRVPTGDRPLGVCALPPAGPRRHPRDTRRSAREPVGLDHHTLDAHLQRGRGGGSEHPLCAGQVRRRVFHSGRRPRDGRARARRGDRRDLPGLRAGGTTLSAALSVCGGGPARLVRGAGRLCGHRRGHRHRPYRAGFWRR